jgi:hypothetical protein
MKLGRLGVWYSTDKLDGPQLRDFVRTVENNGYSNLWYPESRGYESMSLAAWLLSYSEKLMIGSSIANIYALYAKETRQGMAFDHDGAKPMDRGKRDPAVAFDADSWMRPRLTVTINHCDPLNRQHLSRLCHAVMAFRGADQQSRVMLGQRPLAGDPSAKRLHIGRQVADRL